MEMDETIIKYSMERGIRKAFDDFSDASGVERGNLHLYKDMIFYLSLSRAHGEIPRISKIHEEEDYSSIQDDFNGMSMEEKRQLFDCSWDEMEL